MDGHTDPPVFSPPELSGSSIRQWWQDRFDEMDLCTLLYEWIGIEPCRKRDQDDSTRG